MLNVVPHIIDKGTNQKLMKEATEQEVRQAVFQMGGSRTLEPVVFSTNDLGKW